MAAIPGKCCRDQVFTCAILVHVKTLPRADDGTRERSDVTAFELLTLGESGPVPL
jgi:hypothetical protein